MGSVTADGGVFWDGAAILQGLEREVSLGSGLVFVTRTDDPVRSWQRLEPTDAAKNAQSPGRLIISYDGIPTMRRLGSQTCTTEAHANATAVCKANCGNVTAAFLEACAYDVCRAGPDVSISDCLIAWQTKVATSPTISQVTKLVGPGCCRPVMSLENHVNDNATLLECETECRASTDCAAFAISGCSSSTDALCGGSCHLYRSSNDRQRIFALSCMNSALDGNTFCYTFE